MWNFHAYHSVFSKLKNVLSEIHLLLTPGREHGKVFEKVPIIGFRRAKSLKHILVRGTVAPLEKKKGCCRSCWGTRYEICKHVVITETFRSFSTQREYCIKPDNLSCCSSNIVYLFFMQNMLKPILTQWTQIRRFAIFSTSKFHVESSSRFHQFWNANPHGNYDIDLTWKFRRGFDFQNRRNIDEFSRWIFLCRFDFALGTCSNLIWYMLIRCLFNDTDVITDIGTIGTISFRNFATTQINMNKVNFYLLQNNTNQSF